MSTDDFEVPPLSRSQIRGFADYLRDKLQIESPCFPIVRVIELVIPKAVEGFVFDVLDEDEMSKRFGKGCHAMTFPDEPTMFVRNDIYLRARLDKGRDRLTLAHELGHLLLHANLRFARRITSGAVPRFRSSEWQANAFAGELLISAQHIEQCNSVADAIDLFQVSEAAAETQWEVFKRERIIK